jgi:hypothetical protein
MDPYKQLLRELNRQKKAGNKKRRQHLKRELTDDPEGGAARSDFEFGRDISAAFNGLDQDATRRRDDRKDEG